MKKPPVAAGGREIQEFQVHSLDPPADKTTDPVTQAIRRKIELTDQLIVRVQIVASALAGGAFGAVVVLIAWAVGR